MKNPLIILLCVFAVPFASLADKEERKAKGKKEKGGFVTIYDGKDLSKLETKGNWKIEKDGALHLVPREGESGWKRYESYLWLKDQYEDFTCDFEFKVGKGGNSGFYFRISDKSDATLHGFEVQLKDDHGKTKFGPHDVGGVIKTSGPKVNAVNPAGEWNRMAVTLKGSKLKIMLNEQIVQDIDIEELKPEDKKLSGKGWIAFQDHGQEFWLRNIKVKKH